MKKLSFLAFLPFLGGCAIVMASKLPIARPPENLQPGLDRRYVDSHYGFPIAGGKSADGYDVEELQFIDGVPIGWKVARFCIHTFLDACTYCLWEFIGTPIELANMSYPTYVYYVIYDENGKLVRAVSSESEEGGRLALLPWSKPFVDGLKVNKSRAVRNMLSNSEDEAAKANRPAAEPAEENSAEARRAYSVSHFERVANDEFAYFFKVQLNDDAQDAFSAMRKIKQELRGAVVSEYIATYGGEASDVRVDFPEFSMKESVVEGRAEVMRISVVSLQYDATRRKGVISVKIGANRFEDARKWVRKNIETLAKDKNIALTTGTIPPETHFFLGAERVKEGGVLEIEFETE